MSLTNDDVERVLSWEKRIVQECRWEPRQHRSGREIRVNVGFLNPETAQWELGRLHAIALPGKTIRIALLYANEPLRRLDDAPHRNPDGERFDGIHKHRWDETDAQRWVYQPEEFADESLVSHPDRAFHLFLAECSIELTAPYQAFLSGLG